MSRLRPVLALVVAPILLVAFLAPHVVANPPLLSANGIEGAQITSLVADPGTHSTIYAGAVGVIFRSTDTGRSWSSLAYLTQPDGFHAIDTAFPETDAISAIVVDPHDSNLIYAGSQGYIFASTDAGQTWSSTRLPVPDQYDPPPQVSSLVVCGMDGRLLLAGTKRRGLYRSTDAGRTWTNVDYGSSFGVWVHDMEVDPRDSNIVFISTETGVYTVRFDSSPDPVVSTGFPDPPATALAALPDGRIFALSGSSVYKLQPDKDWVQLGPGNLEGSAFDIALDLNEGNRVWAATDTGIYYLGTGVYGQTWRKVNEVSSPFYTTRLLFPPQVPGIALAGGRFGIMRTEDGGRRWTESNAGLTGAAVSRIVAGTGGLCYAATDQGLFRSRDGGATWERRIEHTPFTDVDADVLNPEFVYAVGHQPLGSSDAGDAWTELSAGNSVAVPPGDPHTVIVAAAGADPFSHFVQYSLAKSVDAGRTFATSFSITLSDPSSVSAHGQDIAISRSNPDVVYAALGGSGYQSNDRGATWHGLNIPAIRFEVSPVNEGVVFASSAGALRRSTDGGQNWESLPIPEAWTTKISVEGWPSAMAADPEHESCLVVGTQEGFLLFSQDFGESWREIGRAPSEVLSLARDRSVPGRLLVGTAAGLFTLKLNSTSRAPGVWTTVGPHGAEDVSALAVSGTQSEALLAGTESGILVSLDGGNSWSPSNSGLLDPFKHVVPPVRALAVDPDNPLLVYAGTKDAGMFRSTDGGSNWISIRNGLTSLAVSAIAILPGQPKVIFCGTGYGGWSAPGGVYRSLDGGESWAPANGSLTEFYSIDFVVVSPDSAVYRGDFFNGLHRSTDQGVTWEPVEGDLEVRTATGFAVDPSDPQTLYLVQSVYGLFKSVDGGRTWRAINQGLPRIERSVGGEIVWIRSVLVDPDTPQRLLAGTHNKGVYESRDGGQTWRPLNQGLTDFFVNTLLFDRPGESHVFAGTAGGISRFGPESSFVFPQFGSGQMAGSSLSSQLVLMNLDLAETANVSLRFKTPAGNPLETNLDGAPIVGQTDLALPPGGVRFLNTSDTGPLVLGSVEVSSDRPLGGSINFLSPAGLAGVPNSSRVQRSFWIPVQQNQSVNTGFAIRNWSAEEAQVEFALFDSGATFEPARKLGSAQMAMPANGQLSLFTAELEWKDESGQPFQMPSDFVGVLRVKSTEDAAAVAIRTEPGEYAVFPVEAALPDVPETAEIYHNYSLFFPHFGNGAQAGYFLRSQILLLNLQDKDETEVSVRVRDDSGNALSLDLGKPPIDGFDRYMIPAGGLLVLETSGTGALAKGSIEITSQWPIAGVVVFSGNVGVAGIAAIQQLPFGFLAPISRKQSGGIDTGVAIANLEEHEITFSVFLKDREGVAVAEANVTLEPRGQISRFVGEFDWDRALPDDIEGTLQVVTTDRIGATALQVRPGQFSTVPVSPLLPVEPAEP